MTKRPFSVVDKEDIVPVCPHCSKELTEVYRKARGAGLIVGRDNVFFCPHCLKVLGFGQSRMV
jgi:hypothetical protein